LNDLSLEKKSNKPLCMNSKSKALACFRYFYVLLFLFTSVLSYSQGLPGSGVGGGGNRIDGKYKFMPIPYINYDRSFGVTVGAIPMLMFNPIDKDTVSPSSIVGALGMYTTNGSWFGMGFGSFHFKEDKWRVTAAGGLGVVNFQFYIDNPINSWIPYNTEATFIFSQVQRQIISGLYGGLSLIRMDLKTTSEEFPINEKTTLTGVGVVLSMDKRSNVFYPRKGFVSNFTYFTYPELLGNDFVSDKIEVDYNHYFSVRSDKDVIAARAFIGLGIGSLSFNQQFIVGSTDIRGYSQGAFRGNYLAAIQAEYRWNFHKRFGLVGFLEWHRFMRVLTKMIMENFYLA
jgi:hypothetical protein